MNFFEKIKKFNNMYNLPNNDKPTNLGKARLLNFINILAEELEEHAGIVEKMDNGAPESEIMTDIADLYNDLIVYLASENRRWGIPTEGVLDIIMESNFSKLGPDGKAILDERGKVMKGPSYWKPEPKIKELLEKSNEK
jgi:predicted HAD superfamily Cof-like phosphohydrolase